MLLKNLWCSDSRRIHTKRALIGTTTERLAMNTRISYRYADKRNCKQFTTIVVDATITWEQIEPYLASQQSFIPGQVGLEALQLRLVLPGTDHPWHKIVPEDIRPTEAEPTVALSGEDLAWRLAHAKWDASQKKATELFNATTIESKIPTRTPAETLHMTSHVYARDKRLSQGEDVSTPAKPRSIRTR